MPEIIEAPVTHREPTMAQLRSMVARTADSEPAAPAKEPVEHEAAEPEAPAKEAEGKNTDPATAPGSDKQQVDAEEELSENVKKRIEKETQRAARAQSAIDQAVSARKAKEAELAALNGKPGSEPEKHTEPAKDAPPELPDLATFPGTLAEFKVAQAKALKDWQDWNQKQIRETVNREFQEQQLREAGKKAWDEATAKHGADFPALMKTLSETTPQDFQSAVSALDDWSTVAVHLAKNEEERNALVEKYKVAPLTAIAQLGKLEDRLKPAATPVEDKPSKELPKPLKAVGGGALGIAPAVDLDKASMGQFRKEVNRRLGNK